MINNYPYSDAHELNLDYILKKIKELNIKIDDFEVVNKITYKGAWDITKMYTAWNLVSYNNRVYISLKPVPTGIDINDTDYWETIVDYNISAQYVSFVGDSYLAMTGSDIAEKVAQQLDLTLAKHAISSEGFVHPAGTNTFINNLDAFSASEKNATKYLITYGGLNDFNETEADVYDAVVAYINKAKAEFPNAVIIIIGPQTNISLMNSPSLLNVHNGIMQACLDNGVTYVDARYWLRNVPYIMTDVYMGDFTHPNALGRNIIISNILSVINGNGKINYMKPAIKVLTSGDLIRYSVTDNAIEFEFRGGNRTYTAGTNNFLFELFNIAPEVVGSGVSNVFDVYSMTNSTSVNDRIGTAKLYRSSSLQCLWIPSTTYTGYITVKGRIPFWDVVSNEM